MSDFAALLREYFEILDTERELKTRKEALREAVLGELVQGDETRRKTADGTAERSQRYTLKPRRDQVLELLTSEDILAFSNFTPTKVRNLLVPIYGRERLLPIFDITKKESLLIKRPGAAESFGLP